MNETEKQRPAEPTPLEHLQAELDRTAVISPDFKKTIKAWAYEIARDAYVRGGRDEEKSQP